MNTILKPGRYIASTTEVVDDNAQLVRDDYITRGFIVYEESSAGGTSTIKAAKPWRLVKQEMPDAIWL